MGLRNPLNITPGPHAILSYDHKKLETIICLVLESVINRDVERNAAGLKAGEPSSVNRSCVP